MQNVSNPSLFASLPSIDVNGTLAYEANADAFGTSTFEVAVRDDGDTATGGVNTSPFQTFTISIEPVNDAPSFASLANIEALVNTTHTLSLVDIVAGNLETQNLSFSISSDNEALVNTFDLAYISAEETGSFTFTTNANAVGTANITVTLQDDGGTANGGLDMFSQSFRLTVGNSQTLFLPTFFSPNDDGDNDRFILRGGSVAEASLLIFDINNHVVFESHNVTEITEVGWDGTSDGKIQPAGVYFWRLTGTFRDGRPLTISNQKFQNVNRGRVNLAR